MRVVGGNAMRGAILTILAAGVLVVALGAFLYWYVACPCERLPGATLSGELVETPVQDWSFANDVPLCQIQVDAGLIDHALNLNCMATREGKLYLSCASCDGKRWSTAAQENPRGRIRLGENLYPVTFTRVLDPAEVDLSWRARTEKLQGPDASIPPRSPDWWTFRVESAAAG